MDRRGTKIYPHIETVAALASILLIPVDAFEQVDCADLVHIVDVVIRCGQRHAVAAAVVGF